VPRRASGDRRDPLNRKAIAAAAIRILDDGGLDGFTMRRVADALGTGPASLYWHVGSKDTHAPPDDCGQFRRARWRRISSWRLLQP